MAYSAKVAAEVICYVFSKRYIDMDLGVNSIDRFRCDAPKGNGNLMLSQQERKFSDACIGATLKRRLAFPNRSGFKLHIAIDLLITK